MNSFAAVYLGSAFLGAILGGLISLALSARTSREQRRTRYGEELLRAIGDAQRRIAAAIEGVGDSEETPRPKLVLRDEAVSAWVQTSLATTLEGRAGAKAMNTWSNRLYADLIRGASTRAELEQLEYRLDLAVFLIIAWIAGQATGRDFLLSDSEIERAYAPVAPEA